MGIDFSHGGASWSYGGFGQFRTRLAEAIGITLTEMRGFRGLREWSTVDDPIVPLLNHSDCDGELPAIVCATVAPRLREIVSAWPDDPFDYDRENALRLADGMEECAALGVPMEFT